SPEPRSPNPAPRDLASLAASDLSRGAPFVCHGCDNQCEIDQFEVAGRRFPFGGRCSRFENLRRCRGAGRDVPDLVEARNRLIFAPVDCGAGVSPAPAGFRGHDPDFQTAGNRVDSGDTIPISKQPEIGSCPRNPKSKIGIPRALTAHSLYPLYATFFSRLGFEPVLSGVDSAGWLKAYSGFCFPVQIAHGAVLDLVKRGLDRIFLPHVSRMPNHEAGRDSYLCPITQAAPYFMTKAFPGVAFLSPILSFARGYEACTELADMACEQLGVPKADAAQAYSEAVQAQLQAEQAMQRLGREALAAARADGQPTVILVGRSYNAFSPEASQSVGRKLASMGVRVIPGDCLLPVQAGPTAWHYPNIILNAVSLAKQHANVFLVYVSNFSCTIDAFTHAMIPAQLGAKPYLMLEVDAHSADAGTQTRLEAFRDIIARYRPGPSSKPPFRAATVGILDVDPASRDSILDGAGEPKRGWLHPRAAPANPIPTHREKIQNPKSIVTTSSGERLDLDDPRVKLHFPTFSFYHGRAVALAARWMGLNVGPVSGPDRRQLERGLQHTSGRECLPLPICIGQMLEAHAQRKPGEVVGFYMVHGGAPCVVDRYLDYFHQFIEANALEDLFIFDPQEANEYYGMSYLKMSQALAQLLTLADIFVEMEQSLRVVGQPGALERLKSCWETKVDAAPSLKVLRAGLERLVEHLAAIPHTDPTRCPKVVVTGDFFIRFTPSFMEGVHDLYARHGIILVPVGLNELLLYAAYAGMALTAEDWGLATDSPRAAARACFRVFQPDGKAYLANWTEYHRLKYYDTSFHNMFQRTGLLVTGLNDIAGLFRHARAHLSPAIVGEAVPTVGKGIVAGAEGYQGIIAIGPFNCLPFRISEAILKPHCLRQGMPILTYESDGFSVSPAFLRQAELHIQQVLACWLPARRAQYHAATPA
ncbi:MAG: acyl-CoA dehydratase activase-related protein, partial [Planctomycetota bacterium]